MKYKKSESGVIYKITNPKGRVYIGQTVNYTKRLSEYRYLHNCIRSQKRIGNSLKKYGFENHLFEILETLECDKLNEREKYLILHYKCNYRRFKEYNGLNLTDGGQSANYRRKPMTDEHKRKIGDSHKGKKMSEWGRKKCGESMRGKKHRPEIVEIIRKSSTGRKLSEEAKEKVRQCKIGSRMPSVWKPVKMLDAETGEVIKIFNCVADVAKFFNKKRVCLHAVCTGKGKTRYGYKWEYDLSLNKLLRRA